MNEEPAIAMDALDRALAQTLPVPPVPAGFRADLFAAVRCAEGDIHHARVRLEQERSDRLAELDAGYAQQRRRALANLVGGAIAAGFSGMLLAPWLDAAARSAAPMGLNLWIAIAALGIGVIYGIHHLDLRNPFELL